jgi:hypothetical protein
MSDDAYMSFLNKANADLDAGRTQQSLSSSSAAAVHTETVDVNVSVPAPLTSVNAYYISDTDEPFEPVALRWEGAEKGVWPDAGTSLSSILALDGLLFVTLWMDGSCS